MLETDAERLDRLENSMPRIVPSGGANAPSPLGGTATTAGFFGATPVAKPTVTGAKGANAALTSLLAALVSLGLITDTTTA